MDKRLTLDADISGRFAPWKIFLAGILLLFACLSTVGLTWGLPTSRVDEYLFSGEQPWPGEKIYRLAGAADRFAPGRGADVDVDPLDKSGGEPLPLTVTDEDVARIYLRYRLYTNQPDEMITMMALAGMKPSRLEMDPRLYQYGGLFIYPVGALIKLGGIIGLIDVRGDVVHYLDHPDAFGRFYVVARLYSAAWGLLGVFTVFAIARRLGDWRTGLVAALLFTLMPVVICMAHEGKPHLPGAVLMLLAVFFAMHCLSNRHSVASRDWWLMCLCCGAALAMVLSSLPIFILIPLVALIKWRRARTPATVENSPATVTVAFSVRGGIVESILGVVIASFVYLIANPYIVINLFRNREVLRDNFGNSLAMYEIARIGEGFVRVVELAVEGATVPVVVLGTVALVVALLRGRRDMWPLVVPAVVFFVQFVAIGAGKPGEYGRFCIFFNTAFAIGTACVLVAPWTKRGRSLNWVVAVPVVLWAALGGAEYLRNFALDSSAQGTRLRAADSLERFIASASGEAGRTTIAVAAEPAPYCCPPMDFRKVSIVLQPGIQNPANLCPEGLEHLPLVRPVDFCVSEEPLVGRPREAASKSSCFGWAALRLGETPISWANKPLEITGLDKPASSLIPVETTP